VAEDEVINRIFMEQSLQSAGHRVTHASNGLEALELCAASCFDLYLFDIGMPGLNGMDCVRALRERGDRTPAIALTGYASTREAGLFLESGFDRVVIKPVCIPELERCIRELLEERSGT
jgi:two-component system capsular synthesis sensor histidine kinase RcsC